MPSPRNTPTPPSIPDFELLKPIGRGSYGEVWLARSVTGVFRVVKVVRRDRFEDERPYRRELEGISRFQAAVSGRPRQLALLHVGRNEEAGYFYYVMEPADDVETGSAIDPERYVPLTLRELFSRRGRLPAAECVQLALELARGLSVLHAANLIHRDIKPSNIIFVQRVPKLADVGLVASSHSAMTCVGTVGYSPPEGPGSVAADLFALGKVLYEIATGLDREEFPRLPADIADAPDAPLLREINALVLRTCDPDPRARPASADAFARDLELIQAGRSVAFYEALRRRFRVSLVAAGAIAVLAAFGAALFFWRAGILTAANREISQALYRSDLSIAKLAHATGDYGRARAALERQIPRPGQTDLRGIEWNILAHSVRGDGIPLEPATNGIAILSIAADPTGRWLAAAFADDTAALWDLHTRKVVRRLPNVRVLGGFTSDSLLVVDEPKRAIRLESPTTGVLKEIPTGQRLYTLTSDGHFVVMSPEGDFLLSTLDSEGHPIRTPFNLTINNPGYEPSHSVTTPNGSTYIAGLFQEQGAHRIRRLSIIDLNQNTELWRRDFDSRIIWIATSPDNAHFVANIGGQNPTLFSIASPNDSKTLVGHSSRVEAAAFSPDGQSIATVGADQTVRTWRASTGALLETYMGLIRPGTFVVWLANGTQIAAGDDQGALMLFEHPKRPLHHSRQGFHADVNGDLIYSPDSAFIAVSRASNRLDILKTSSLEVAIEVTGVFQPAHYSQTGTQLAGFASDWSLMEIDCTTGKSINSTGSYEVPFQPSAWSRGQDGRKAVLIDRQGRFACIDLSSGKGWEQTEPEGDKFWATTFDGSNNELLTASLSGNIRRWNGTDGAPLGELTSVDGEAVTLELSPNGRWLAVSVAGDSSIRILDMQSRSWTHRLLSHRRFVTSLAFTPSSDRLVSGGADGRAIIWQIPDFHELTVLESGPANTSRGDEGIAVLRVAPNERSLAALTEDGRVVVWRIEP